MSVLSSYEAKVWGPGGYGTELVPVVAWEIGMLLTKHHGDCRVLAELRRSAHAGEQQDKRLEHALATACTCGARAAEQSRPAPIKSTVPDRRDNRDPEQVGLEHLNRS